MSGDVFVLDTNFVLDYFKSRPGHVAFMEEHVRHTLWASVITEMELYSFHGITDGEIKVLDSFMASIKIAPLDESVKRLAISFRRATRRKIPDSIVAATAVGLDAILMTNDGELLRTMFPNFIARSV